MHIYQTKQTIIRYEDSRHPETPYYYYRSCSSSSDTPYSWEADPVCDMNSLCFLVCDKKSFESVEI